MRAHGARTRRLVVWFALNFIIFIVCYLNYRLQLKHRYLYRTLNVGLCFSRAAAMVINFNLLLVWLPMCKYSLTWLACLASSALRRHREERAELADQRRAQRCDLPLEKGPAGNRSNGKFSFEHLVKSLRWSAAEAVRALRGRLLAAKINTINSFLVAVDHCKSLHTICATTITSASVIHTVAHLINVMNFSKNYDPLLGNLNMADYKGQNPFQLLISIHLYATFVLEFAQALISSSPPIISHVIKEQSNVERHHPDHCYQRMLLAAAPQPANLTQVSPARPANGNYDATTVVPAVHLPSRDNATALGRAPDANASPKSIPSASGNETGADLNVIRLDNLRPDEEGGRADRFCLDPRPLFVAQSSICWYVLAVGLSCYLFDLLLRRLRRSKSSIELLAARQDLEQNLVELVLSNNHRRFAHWAPGQFVYLNCPQIAAYEWHPFTISSMDEPRRQFTLHIRAGGDWTRKLRQRLCEPQNCAVGRRPQEKRLALGGPHLPDILPDYSAQGQLQVRLVRVSHNADDDDDNHSGASRADPEAGQPELANPKMGPHQLDLYIDGPFHSPFERLLEQQVSICIANGVGWTAFSSVFQCISANQRSVSVATGDCWWAKWRHLARQPQGAATVGPPIETKLHLMVIVTSLEQLRPFYQLAIDYFRRLEPSLAAGPPEDGHQLNPVREITAFITRSSGADQDVREFCRRENLGAPNDKRAPHEAIRVNSLFTIRFGKPQFDLYLSSLGALYLDRPKVSVYCCGSYQVKRDVRQICHNLNRLRRRPPAKLDRGPLFSYREENF